MMRLGGHTSTSQLRNAVGRAIRPVYSLPKTFTAGCKELQHFHTWCSSLLFCSPVLLPWRPSPAESRDSRRSFLAQSAKITNSTEYQEYNDKASKQLFCHTLKYLREPLLVLCVIYSELVYIMQVGYEVTPCSVQRFVTVLLSTTLSISALCVALK